MSKEIEFDIDPAAFSCQEGECPACRVPIALHTGSELRGCAYALGYDAREDGDRG